jgi:hypothetical protein
VLRKARSASGGKESAGKVIATDLIANVSLGADQRAIGARVNLALQVVDVNIHDMGRLYFYRPGG